MKIFFKVKKIILRTKRNIKIENYAMIETLEL